MRGYSRKTAATSAERRMKPRYSQIVSVVNTNYNRLQPLSALTTHVLEARTVSARGEKRREVADVQNVAERAALVRLLRVVRDRDLVADVVAEVRRPRARGGDAAAVVEPLRVVGPVHLRAEVVPDDRLVRLAVDVDRVIDCLARQQ